MIAALGAQNRVIGKDNGLVWKISEDLKRFKQLTTGHVIIMGRKTYESIGRPLPNRTNFVITRSEDFVVDSDVRITHSVAEAIAEANLIEEEEIFIIGGGEIYAQALPFADRLYLTLVHSDEPGTVFFPEYSEFTTSIFLEEHPEHDPPYTYTVLEKTSK
ncbi:MAG: dihydrofolate reductase [Candidatus Paceibacter sp.]|jgi:dihydrofolate reductase|nr:dihydrofolate reductase [Candidatus Paceibacter sp.]